MLRSTLIKYLKDDQECIEYVLEYISARDLEDCPIPRRMLDELSCTSEGAHKHDERFRGRSTLPCYIPENAQEIDSVYCYYDLYEIVSEWLEGDGKEWGAEHPEHNIESLTEFMYDMMQWEYPSTFLDQLLN